MKIKKVFISESGVLYFSCISKGYGSPVFLKKDKSAKPTRINFEEWGKINPEKELQPKKLKRYIKQGVAKFIIQLMLRLKEHAKKPNNIHPLKSVTETLVRAKPVYRKVGT